MSPIAVQESPERLVLNVGCGPANPLKLHAAFRSGGWREVRLDVEATVCPDILADMANMRGAVADASFDALWSSHNVEHLAAHRVSAALAEFFRVLRPTGFALLTCPDIEAVARLVLERGLDGLAYDSPAGPVTPRDMLWGFGPSIAAGYDFMAHRTGFTADSLARQLLAAGFAEVRVAQDRFALWALCFMPGADPVAIARTFAETGQAALFGLDEAPPAAAAA